VVTYFCNPGREEEKKKRRREEKQAKASFQRGKRLASSVLTVLASFSPCLEWREC
jgi:hypothetical protein